MKVRIRIVEPIQGSLQVIGGISEMGLGYKLKGFGGGYIFVDDFSNVTGGFSRFANGIKGNEDGDSANFMKAGYKVLCPEYGEQIYSLSQIGIGILSMRQTIKEIPDIPKSIKFYPRKKNIMRAHREGLSVNTLVLDIENQIVVTSQTNSGMVLQRMVIDKG